MPDRRDLDLIPLEDVEGDARPSHRPDAPPRRWLPVSVVAVLVVAVAAALVFSDDDDQGASPATTAPTTSAPLGDGAPAGPGGSIAARGMLLDDPAWYFASAGNIPLSDGTDGAVTRVWRAPDGGALMVEYRPVDGAGPSGVAPVVDGVWTDVDGMPLVVRRTTTERLAARRQVGGWDIAVESVGVDRATVARFVASITIEDRRPVVDEDVLGPQARLASRPFPAAAWLAGAVVARTEYRTAAKVEPLVLQVGLRPLQPGQGVLDLLADRVDDRDGIVTGALLSQPGTNIAQWYLPDGRVATATGPVPTDELRRIAALARVATADEWVQVIERRALTARPRASIVLGSGTTSDAITWQAGVQRIDTLTADGWRWWWTAPAGDGAEWAWLDLPVDEPLPRSLTVAYPGLTYVLVALPAGSGRWTVTVGTDGSEVATVAQPLAGSPWAIAALAVEQPGPFRVVASRPGEADVLVE